MMILVYGSAGLTTLINSDHIIAAEMDGEGFLRLFMVDRRSITLDLGESKRVWQLLLKKD